MAPQAVMVAAGYSPLYVQHQGYKAIKRPCIQSVFTDSCERILAKRQMQFDELVEPYFDGLKAKVIMKSQQLGDAQETEFPDHALRMNAADRLVDLYGGKSREVEMPTEPSKGITIHLSERIRCQGRGCGESHGPHEHHPGGRDQISQVASAACETEWIDMNKGGDA
jgi:hypothetical protein